MFSPLWRTQAPFPAAMLSAEILSGSGNPRWNHFPRHDSGKEHREEPETKGDSVDRPRRNWGMNWGSMSKSAAEKSPPRTLKFRARRCSRRQLCSAQLFRGLISSRGRSPKSRPASLSLRPSLSLSPSLSLPLSVPPLIEVKLVKRARAPFRVGGDGRTRHYSIAFPRNYKELGLVRKALEAHSADAA